jgi:hypothetical protein
LQAPQSWQYQPIPGAYAAAPASVLFDRCPIGGEAEVIAGGGAFNKRRRERKVRAS